MRSKISLITARILVTMLFGAVTFCTATAEAQHQPKRLSQTRQTSELKPLYAQYLGFRVLIAELETALAAEDWSAVEELTDAIIVKMLTQLQAFNLWADNHPEEFDLFWTALQALHQSGLNVSRDNSRQQ